MPTIIWWILGLAAAGTAGYAGYRYYHESHGDTGGPSCPTDAQLTQMVADIDSGKATLAIADEWVKAYKDCPTTSGALAKIIVAVRTRTNALGSGSTVANAPASTVPTSPLDPGKGDVIYPAVPVKVTGPGFRRSAPPWMGGPRRRAA